MLSRFDTRLAQDKQVDSQLAEIVEQVRCHQQLLDELSQRRPNRVAARESHEMSPLSIDNDRHNHDLQSPDLKTMAATIKTANSLVEKRSRANCSEPEQRRSHGTETNGEQSDGGVALPFSRTAGTRPPTIPTLEFRTLLLDKYMLQAEEHFKCGSYAKCEEYLRKAIEQGNSRYEEYGQVFEQWLDIQIKLAEVFQRQGQYQNAEKLLSNLISMGEYDGQVAHPDHCHIAFEQLGRLYHAMAGLQLYRYRTTGDIGLGELSSMVKTAYNFASHLHMEDSLSTSLQRLLTQCASTYLEVCELEGDQVTAEALCERHPGLRRKLTPESQIVEPTVPTHFPEPPVGSILSQRRPSSQITPISNGFSEPERGRAGSILSLTADTDISKYASNLLTEVENGSVTLTRLLLEMGVDTEQTNSSGLTPLLIAAKNRNLEMLQLLLDCPRTNIHAKDHNGLTVLHHALIGLGGKSIDKMVKAILEKDVDVNAPDKDGRRPLHYCVEYNNTSAAAILLASGRVDIEAQNAHSETAAMVAARRKYPNVEMICLLHKHGASIDRKSIPRSLQLKLNQLDKSGRQGSRRSSRTWSYS